MDTLDIARAAGVSESKIYNVLALWCSPERKWKPPSGRTTHGMSKSPEYRCFQTMLARCRTPSCSGYHRYGGRGIKVCERWQKFEAFYADMGPRPSPKHSIDRIDNDGDYEPGNCRWATKKQQANNKSDNVSVSVDGQMMTASECADHLGVSVSTVHRNARNGHVEFVSV